MCCIADLRTCLLLHMLPCFAEFSFFPFLKKKIFVKGFCGIMKARLVTFDMQIVDNGQRFLLDPASKRSHIWGWGQVDDNMLYRWTAKRFLQRILPCICPIYFLSIL